jgi:hypothetical protein
MYVNKAPFPEEPVDSLRDPAPYPKSRLEGVRTGAKVLDGTQEFKGMTFFLKGIIGVASSEYLKNICLYLKRLRRVRSQFQIAFYKYRAACAERPPYVIGDIVSFKYDLNAFERRSVCQLDEPQRFAFAYRPDPPRRFDFARVARGIL